MNKIFKVVWSKTKNCYVVTSELAKNHTKNNQTKAETSAIGRFFYAAFVSKHWSTMTVRAVVAVLALTGLTGITFNVSAADTDANANPTSEHFVSVNFQPTTVYSGVAFNGDYKTFAANVYTAYVNKIVQYETAIAQNVYNGTTTDAATLATYATDLQKYETDLLNLGYDQTQINALKVNNIKGITRTYDNGKLILTVDANPMKTAYADANTATGAVTSAQSSDTDQTAIDTATTTMLGSRNYNNNQAIGKQSIAIGFDALADGSSPNAVALGANTQITSSDSAVALGANNAIQNSKGALAMGNNVTISNSSGAIVFGDRVAGGDGKLWAAVTDNAKESVAIGLNAYTSNAPYAVAIGSNARAFNEGGQNNGQESVAIGHNARTINMSYSIAIGSDAQASDKGHPSSGFNNSIAIGTVANANTSIDSVAIGHSSNASSAKESIALGKGANVSGKTGALAIGSATTANSDYSISIGYNTKNNGTSSIAIGNKTSNNGKSSIAIGDNVSFTATSDESIVIGNNITLEGGGKTSTSSILIGGTASDGSRPSITKVNGGDMNYSVVIGAGARVSDALLGTDAKYWIKGIADETVFPTMQSVTNDDDGIIGGKGEGTAVGNSTWASGQAAAFGNNAYALGRSSIAIGNDDNDAYKDPQYYVSDYDGEHYFNKLYKAMLDEKKKAGVDVTNTLNSVNGYILDKKGNLVRDTTNFNGRLKYSPTMAVGQGSMAIGSRSMAYADNATAIGALTFAIGKGSTALGTLTRAEGAASMAMGNNSYVFANNAIASGSSSQVLSEGGNAYGYRTYAGGKNSLAVGSNAYANVKINFGTKDGHAVFDANGLYNSDPSRYAKSILTGKDLKEITENDDLITVDGLNGDKSYLDNLDDLLTADTNPGLTTAKAETTTFHGVSGVVVAAEAEDNPDKNAENSIVIGNNAIATAGNAIAMGKGAIITDDATNGMALGSYSMTTGRNSVALGLASRATGINSMAVGTASSANAENALSVGIAAINEGKNSSVIGFSSGVAHDSENSIIFGTNSVIDAGVTNSIVIGTGSSIGRYLMDDVHLLREINTEVGGVTGDSVESFKQIKTDENKKIDGAMAIGVNARVYNAESTTDSTATTRTSEEGKTLARENGNNAMAIGNGAEAWLENSVALGVNSETDYTPEQMATIAWRTPGAVAASTDVNTGIISIGKKGMERRLVNVAAGAYDTDAVNVSQLMQLWDSVQREVNPIDLNRGVHFLGTNFQKIGSTSETDYAKKYAAQVTYDRFIRTLSEYKSYLIRGEYAGSKLTEKADASYRSDLTKLRNDLVNKYGVSLDQLNADSKLSNFYGTLTENATDHLLQVNLDADGLHAKFALPEYALQDLVEARDTDISVLTQDGNYITGMTSDALTAKIAEINYDNSQALTEGSIAIGYNARVGEKTTDSTGATAIKGQKGGVAIGYEARNMAETDNPNGASVALGDKSIVTEADATKIKKGFYYTNEAKDGITATPNAGVVSVGTSTATTTADGIIYNPSTRRIINVAAGANDTDAVNVSQLKSLAAQKIQLSTNGTTNNKTTDVAIGVDTGVVNFGIKGDGTDITTEASGTDVNIKMNKATTVEAGNNLAVTSDAVNTAITTVNNTINALDGRVTTNTSSIGTLNNQMAHTIEVTGNTTPDSTSNAKSLTTGDISFAINGDGTDITTTTTVTGVRIAVDKTGKVAEGDTKLVTGDTVNTAITNAKNAATTTLTEHADSPVTVTKTTADDGHSNYNVTFNGTKAAEQIPLTYKANGANSTTTSTVMLSDGLNFTSTDNLTASVEANGVVKYTLNKALTGISSISNTATSGDTTTGTTITLSPTSKEVNVGGAKITGLANGSADSDAVTYGQFSNRKISLKDNSNSSTTEKTLANDVSFNIVGAEAAQGSTGPDITTAANGDNVTITLNKATSIASGNTQVATSGQVYDAVTKAKTKVAVNPAENGILTVTNTPGEGTAADTYTLSIDQKTLESNTQLSYQASGDTKEGTTLPRKTSLVTGLNFKTTNNNLTATTDTDGVVTYGLSSTLTDITSITGPKGKDGQTTTMTFGGGKGQTITFTEGTKLTGLADGENDSDAVNVSQLNNLKNKVGYDNAVSSKTDATPGAAGKDGLDGKDLGTQIAAIREGEAGPKIENGKVVGTDGKEITDQTILDKVNEAKVEPKSVESKDVQISAVDPKTGEPKAPTTIGNVKSTIGLNGADNKSIDSSTAKTNVTNLLDKKGSVLNTVATVGDLQAVAQAGLDFKGNTGDAIHKALGSTLLIKGEENANFDDGSFESKNLATKNDNGTLRIGMKKTPTFDGVKVSNGTNTVELKPGEEANTLTLTNDTDGDNSAIKITNVAAGSNNTDAVNYSQLKDLIDKVGAENTNAGTDGKSPSTNPSGNDGLDGKDMGSQIQAIRDGEAGPMVYTDGEGNRVVKDGNTYYKKSDLVGMEKAGDSYYNIEALEKAGAKIVDGQIVNADGKVLEGDELKKVQDAARVTTMPKAVNAKDVQISTVDPKTGEPKAPTTIGNVKSNYGYNGIGTEADGKTPAKGIVNAITPKDAKTAMNGAKDTDGTVTGGLLNAKGADLNKVVTVGDLQAAAQAGLDFTGNSKTQGKVDTAHTTLGGTIAIQGGAEYNANDFSDKNISTKVDPKTKTISINIKKNPEFDSVILGQPGENGQPDKQVTISTANGNEVNFTSTHPQDGDTNVVLSGIKDDPTRRDTAITRGALEDLGILEGEVGPSHIAGSDVGGNLSNGDNLNDYSLTKQVQAQREGLSGNVVYTDAKGNRLVKAGNRFYSAAPLNKYILESKLRQDPLTGMWFNISDFDEDNKVKEEAKGNGLTAEQLAKKAGVSETQVSDIKLSAVNMSGDTNTPTEIGNIKSTIGLNKEAKVDANGKPVLDANGEAVYVGGPIKADAAKKAVVVTDDKGNVTGGLLNVSGSQLNTVATVGDLQAVAQAGLDITANANTENTNADPAKGEVSSKTPMHRTLGSQFAIKGSDNNDNSDFKTNFSTENIMTQVEGNIVRIGMKSTPVFKEVHFTDNGSIKLGTNQNGNLTLTQNGATYEVATKNDGFMVQYKDTDGQVHTTKIRMNNADTISLDKNIIATEKEEANGSTNTSTNTNTGSTTNNGSSSNTSDNTDSSNTSSDTGSTSSGSNNSGTTTGGSTSGTSNNTAANNPKTIVTASVTTNGTIGKGDKATDTGTPVDGKTVYEYLEENYMKAPDIQKGFADVNHRISEVSKQANAGTAAAMAAAGIPQVTNMYDDNLMIGAGVGSYGGESAVAIGVSGTNDDRDITYKIATTYDSRGKWGLSAGIGFSVGSGRDNPTKPERKTMSERIDRLTAENKELRKANEDTLKALDEANKNHLMSLEAANKAQLAQLQESGQAKIDVINATSQAKLDAMKKANEAELDALRKANKAELDKLRASNQAEIKSLTEKNNQLQQQVEKLEAMMNQLMAQNQVKETTAAPTTK